MAVDVARMQQVEATVDVARRRWSVDEYYRMAEAGLLREDDRVELIQGEVIQMSPIGSRHAGCINQLNYLLGQQVGNRAIVAVQNPIRLSNNTEPQPDLNLLRPRPDFYRTAHHSQYFPHLILTASKYHIAILHLTGTDGLETPIRSAPAAVALPASTDEKKMRWRSVSFGRDLAPRAALVLIPL